MQEYAAPFKAIARYATDNASASSVITLNESTTTVEVAILGGTTISGAIRWVPRTETAGVSPFASVIASTAAANFDHAVPGNEYRRFVVPVEQQGINGPASNSSMFGTYTRIAVKANGPASVLVTEY